MKRKERSGRVRGGRVRGEEERQYAGIGAFHILA